MTTNNKPSPNSNSNPNSNFNSDSKVKVSGELQSQSILRSDAIHEFLWTEELSKASSELSVKSLNFGEIHIWYSRRSKQDSRSGVDFFRSLIELYIKEKYRLIRSENGKPVLLKEKEEFAPLSMSISHSDELIGIAFAEAHALGLDLEKIRGVSRGERVAQRYFSEEERKYIFENIPDQQGDELQNRRFIQIWTLKEALIKNRGGNLLLDINKSNLDILNLDSSGELLFLSKNWPQILLNSQLKSSQLQNFSDNFFQGLAVEF